MPLQFSVHKTPEQEARAWRTTRATYLAKVENSCAAAADDFVEGSRDEREAIAVNIARQHLSGHWDYVMSTLQLSTIGREIAARSCRSEVSIGTYCTSSLLA